MQELNYILKKYHLELVVKLANKNDSVVYQVNFRQGVAILKLQRDYLKHRREVTALNWMYRKGFPVPLVYVDGICGDIGYLIEEFLQGSSLLDLYVYLDEKEKKRLLYQAGTLLGRIHRTMNANELENSCWWSEEQEISKSFPDIYWFDFCRKQLNNWYDDLSECKCAGKILNQRVLESLLCVIDSLEGHADMALLHRDYGFRNIMVDNKKINGVIDFEYAVPGDMYFDLAKLIFNDLNFERDIKLREVFLCGWSRMTEKEINWEHLWLYLAYQGLGAIQWVEKQKDPRIREQNQQYKQKGEAIFLRACKEMF